MKTIKRLVILIFILCLGITIAPYPTTLFAQTANLPTQPFGNLVIFVDFENTTTNFVESKRATILDMLEGSKQSSLKSYMDIISNGQFTLENSFAQDDGTTILPVVLANAASAYTNSNESALMQEVINKVDDRNLSPAALDKNQDGEIDNVMFVFNTKTSSRDSVYWAHKTNLNGAATLKGLRVNTYNVHNDSFFNGLISGREGVVAHEFLHSIGYPDLYRSNSSGTPVGGWDIMAENSIYLQYPLAALRRNISKWLTIDEITKDQTGLILGTTGSKNGHQAFILTTPYSSDEYFVVEYRKKTDNMLGLLENKIYGSGIIVYRVDTKVDGNIDGAPDEYYVFRPGEPENNAGKGDLRSSFLSQESSRTTYGSSDFEDGITQGAITYSDGANSGIVINNVGSASGDTISFDVKFADTSKRGIWKPYSGDISSAGTNGIDMSYDGNQPYVVFTEQGKLRIAKATGDDWTTITPSASHALSTVDVENYKIEYYQNKIYILYNDRTSYQAYLVVYDVANGTWETPIEVHGTIAQYTDLEVGSDGVYLVATESNVTNNQKNLYVKKYNSTSRQLDSIAYITDHSNFYNVTLEMDGTTPYLFYRESTSTTGSIGKVAKVESGALIDFPPLPQTSALGEIAIHNNILYTAITYAEESSIGTDRLQVYKLSDNVWQPVGNVIRGNILNAKLQFMSDQPFLAYTLETGTGNEKQALVTKLVDSTWKSEGVRVVENNIIQMAFLIHGNRAFFAYFNASAGNAPYVSFKEVQPLKSTNTNLSYFRIKDKQGNLLLELDPTITNCEVSVPYRVDQVIIDAGVADAKSTIQLGDLGLKNLAVGYNEVNVKVTSESGGQAVYTLQFVREPISNDASLASLTIQGATLTEPFTSDKFTYVGIIPYHVDNITIDATTTSEFASISGLGEHKVQEGKQDITLVVTAEDGSKKTYTFALTKASASASANADLASLEIVDAPFKNEFTKDNVTYEAIVAYERDEIEVVAKAEDDKANVIGSGKHPLMVGDNTISVVVLAENGKTKTYTIKVKRLASVNSPSVYLATLDIQGFTLNPAFDRTIFTYNIKVPESTTQLILNAIQEDGDASIEITGHRNLKLGNNVVNITITLQDGTKQVYTIHVIRGEIATENLEKDDGGDKDVLTPPADEDETINKGGADTADYMMSSVYMMLSVCTLCLLVLLKTKKDFKPYKHKVKK